MTREPDTKHAISNLQSMTLQRSDNDTNMTTMGLQ